MELTEKTLQVLRNYASVNSNIFFEGDTDVVRSVAPGKTIICRATLDQAIPQSFGIYDLGEFLNVLGLTDSPTLSFAEDHVTISDASGRSDIHYYYTDPSLLLTTRKDMPEFDSEINFTLDRETMNKIKRASSTMGYDELVINSRDGIITLSVMDTKDPKSHVFSIAVEGTAQTDSFNVIINISNLKMIDGDYTVGLSSNKISHFVNKESNIEYWVALHKESNF